MAVAPDVADATVEVAAADDAPAAHAAIPEVPTTADDEAQLPEITVTEPVVTERAAKAESSALAAVVAEPATEPTDQDSHPVIAVMRPARGRVRQYTYRTCGTGRCCV